MQVTEEGSIGRLEVKVRGPSIGLRVSVSEKIQVKISRKNQLTMPAKSFKVKRSKWTVEPRGWEKI